MASTRNRNTRGDYLQEELSNKKKYLYHTYEHSQYGKPDSFLDIYKMPNSTLSTRAVAKESLSSNAVDIESFLRGISATNLVTPQPKLTAQLKEHGSVKMFDSVPMVLPNQIKNDQGQRPLLWGI
tara:strand:+ start:2124 stop:2498 length:375 start_codon:yes stop_codon:yes gene_type:complete